MKYTLTTLLLLLSFGAFGQSHYRLISPDGSLVSSDSIATTKADISCLDTFMSTRIANIAIAAMTAEIEAKANKGTMDSVLVYIGGLPTTFGMFVKMPKYVSDSAAMWAGQSRLRDLHVADSVAIRNISLTPGPKGDSGARGLQGIQGIQGIQGNTGAKGDTGSQGIQGAAGTNGSTGATGSVGLTGATGPAGTTGAQGSIGLTGSTGSEGIQGVKGDTGLTGATGSAGTNGTNGTNATVTAGSGINVASGVVTNTAQDQTVAMVSGTGITVSGTYPSFTVTNTSLNSGKISYSDSTTTFATPKALRDSMASVRSAIPPPPSASIVTRAIGSSPTSFTVSATRPSLGIYSITCATTNPLLVGTSSLSVFLEYSINAGSTWLSAGQSGASSGVGITVTLQLTTGQTGAAIGFFPANALVRIRTTTAGTASATYITGQEVIF